MHSNISTFCHVFRFAFLRTHAATWQNLAALCLLFSCNAVHAGTVEDTFLQAQTQLEQGNTAMAEVNLARLPKSSPYAKLLAGNIAAKKQQDDQAFLLLLPLQSNPNFMPAASASLHSSLSDVYARQGLVQSAVEQLLLRETYLNDASRLNENQASIWKMLTALPTENLIEMRGESTDTALQGWIDLALAAKHQDLQSELTGWYSNYPDHSATAFAKNLASQTRVASTDGEPQGLIAEGGIALILPFDNPLYSAKLAAYKLGLETAFTKNSSLNDVKSFASLGDATSFADLYAFAKDEGAAYVVGPLQVEEIPLDGDTKSRTTLSLLPTDQSTPAGILPIGFSLADEAQAIANFAQRNAIQRILILASDKPLGQQQTESFQTLWQAAGGQQATVLSLAADKSDSALLNIKSAISSQPHDLLVLAVSGEEALTLKPYLDISTPTIAFASVNQLPANTDSGSLNAIRVVDLPFLLDAASFADYNAAASELKGDQDLLRWFALGVDTAQLLGLQSTTPAAQDRIFKGLTGTLKLDAQGRLTRQLPIARFTYQGLELE